MSHVYVLYFVLSSFHSKKATRTLHFFHLGVTSKQDKIADKESLFLAFLEA